MAQLYSMPLVIQSDASHGAITFHVWGNTHLKLINMMPSATYLLSVTVQSGNMYGAMHAKENVAPAACRP